MCDLSLQSGTIPAACKIGRIRSIYEVCFINNELSWIKSCINDRSQYIKVSIGIP